MNSSDYAFPWFTNVWWIVAIFVTAVILFHVAFVWVGKLTSINWKRVDYVWVSLAFLGVFSSVETTRVLVAKNLADLATSRVGGATEFVRSAASFGASPAICREFVRSAASPPEDVLRDMQHRFDEQCAWFRKLIPLVDRRDRKNLEPIDVIALAGPQPPAGEPWAYASLTDAVQTYNAALAEAERLRKLTKTSVLSDLVQILGPALLAIAMALRLAKVTGEVEIEKARAKNAG